MPKNYILFNDIKGNPKNWSILNREKDCILSSEDENKIVEHLNQLYEENQNLKDEVYEELDNALKLLQEVYENSRLNDGKKLSQLYNRLKGLQEEIED